MEINYEGGIKSAEGAYEVITTHMRSGQLARTSTNLMDPEVNDHVSLQ